MSTLREVSKIGWVASSRPAKYEDINTGCLQRIADATEKMAENYDRLLQDREYYRDLAEARRHMVLELQRSRSALRGVITRLKSKGGAA